MDTLPMISQMLPNGIGVLAGIDVDGFLTGTSFLTALASAISAFILSLFNIFLGGIAGTTG